MRHRMMTGEMSCPPPCFVGLPVVLNASLQGSLTPLVDDASRPGGPAELADFAVVRHHRDFRPMLFRTRTTVTDASF